MQKWREKGNKSTYRVCVCLGSVDVEKPLSLFFCFLESANNVSENQTPVQPETKSERSVLIEIENNNHFAKNIQIKNVFSRHF